MRIMIISDIDFPNKILDAIKDNKLVIFAGAGVSMGKPTKLPDFKKLAQIIADGTGKTISKKESYEVFLGSLNSDGIDVSQKVAEHLSDSKLEHNSFHEAIVELFPITSQIKIVTTNYDKMFEQVIRKKGIKVPIYSSPALPLGDDVSGLIHIHGTVDESAYMVVTDEDFGKAYLSDGYVSRFLVKLFETYTVLFVGYSYNDTIMRYLTRAMHRKQSAEKYILTDNPTYNWKALGITPILFPKNKFSNETEGLKKLGQYAKKGLYNWRSDLLGMNNAPPKSITALTEIDYCLENFEISRVLANCIQGIEWLEFLDEKGILSCCFTNHHENEDQTKLWGNWICDNFLGKDDHALIKLFTSHANKFNRIFSNLFLTKLSYDKPVVDEDYFGKYVTIINNYDFDSEIFSRLIELSHNKKLHHLCLQIFKKYFDLSAGYNSGFFADLESYCNIGSEYYLVARSWNKISHTITQLYPCEIIEFVELKIEEIYWNYYELFLSEKNKEPFSISMIEIENADKSTNENPITILARAYQEAIKKCNIRDYKKGQILRCLDSKCSLLRRISLIAIRESDLFTDDEKIDIVMQKELLWSILEKEQVFLLVKSVFVSVSEKKQDEFISLIKNGQHYDDDRSNAYSKYNWCVWLELNDISNNKIRRIRKNIEGKYGFSPRRHPEKSILVEDVNWAPIESPITENEMLDIPKEELLHLLKTYKEDIIEGPSRLGLMELFATCVKNHAHWAIEFIEYCYEQKNEDEDIWYHFFWGLNSSDISIQESMNACGVFLDNIDKAGDLLGITRFLNKTILREEVKSCYEDNETALFNLSCEIWKRRKCNCEPDMELKDRVYNSITGLIVTCWINMVCLTRKESISQKLIELMDHALSFGADNREVSICTIVGHLSFWLQKQKKWCLEKLKPFLMSSDRIEYVSAWTGVAYFSRQIPKDHADIIKDIYYESIEKLDWLEKNERAIIVELYLTLIIYYVDKPNKSFIPQLYKCSVDVVVSFVNSIRFRLNAEDDNIILNWWDIWLRRFLKNRMENIPTELSDKELQALYMLIPKLDCVLDDAIGVFLEARVPSSVNHLFWFELDNDEMIKKHPKSIAYLLIKVLEKDVKLLYCEDYICDISEKLNICVEDREKLNNAMLKHNIWKEKGTTC